MKRTYLSIVLALLVTCFNSMAYDWDAIAIPADAGSGYTWELQENVSDDFNYTFNASSSETTFGSGKWKNFYHNSWDGPGSTYWLYDHVSVSGGDLILRTSEKTYFNAGETDKGGVIDVNSACVTSQNTVVYPVYVESSISVANIALASCFWLLSPDDHEEIDIIENYGGVSYWKQFTHISHHSFERDAATNAYLTDYQPKDWESWWPDSRVSANSGWGDWCWNGGSRQYLRMGVYWIGPHHIEYYIDGSLVRVMYDNAIATNYSGTWYYTYYDAIDGNGLPTSSGGAHDGYSNVTTYTTSSSYSFATHQAASNASNGLPVIDPGWFQGSDANDADGDGIYNEAKGFTKDLDIIINVESQGWLNTNATYCPTSADLADASKNQMKVDWVRVYKPVASGTTISVSDVSLPETATVSVNSTTSLTASITPSNATNQSVTWSSNSGNATVSTTGVVTGVSEGQATITVTTADGGYTDQCVVTVAAAGSIPEVGITMDDASKYTSTSYVSGETLEVTLSYNAGDGKTVGTSQYGVAGVQVLLREMTSDWLTVVNDYSAVDATIVGQQYGELTLSIDLTDVTPSAELTGGNFYFLYPQFTTNDGTVYDVSGLNPISVVAAASGDIDVAGITVDEIASVDVDGTVSLTASITPSNATNQNVTWTSNSANATVSTTGVVTGKSAGQAIITVTTVDGGYAAQCTVTVSDPVVEGGLESPFTLEAEDFDRTGGVSDPWGLGSIGVRQQDTYIDYVNSQDYVEFDVIIAEAGTYVIEYTICAPDAATANDPKIDMYIGSESSPSSSVAVPNSATTVWDAFYSLDGGTVDLPAGAVTIKVLASGSSAAQFNLDKITFEAVVVTTDVLGKAEFEVFPIPASTTCYVKGAEGKLVNIYSLSGALMLSQQVVSALETIDISELSAGIYIVAVDGIQRKLIVE